MALIKCSECGKEISNLAKHCTNCGFPLAEEKSQISVKAVEKKTNYAEILKKYKYPLIGCLVFILGVIAAIINIAPNYGVKPDNMSEESYECGIQALDYLDKYMAGEIDQETCYFYLDMLYTRSSSIRNEGYSGDSSVSTYILLSSVSVLIDGNSIYVKTSDIEEARDNLAKILNEK